MRFLLCGINAKYIHSNLAIFSLKAYADRKKIPGAEIILKEYTINNYVEDILQDLYETKADVVIFSCYIWNISFVRELAAELKKVSPAVKIWAGGPEVSYAANKFLEQNPAFDLIMQGEGEEVFSELIRFALEDKYFAGEENTNLTNHIDMTKLQKLQGIAVRDFSEKSALENGESSMESKSKIINTGFATLMNMDTIPFVYEDFHLFEHKILYYETSRGCPFRCSYCLSSVDKTVRFRSLELVKKELDAFLEAKVPQVKFVDRTFNCNRQRAIDIWSYLVEHDNGITNFHFEIAADLLTDEEADLIAKMRPGLIQLEIGVQSTHDETIREIHRHMDLKDVHQMMKKVQKAGNIHQHLDLIAGLPFEDYETFTHSFDDIYEWKPEQLQLGFLKVLKGSYMYEHAKEYEAVYRAKPPYEVLRTKWLSYEDICNIKLAEEMLEVYYNSTQFPVSIRLLETIHESAYHMFENLGHFYEEHGYLAMSHTRMRRSEILLEYIESLGVADMEVFYQAATYDIYSRENAKSRPKWAKDYAQWKDVTRAYCPKGSLAHIECFDYSFEEDAFGRKCEPYYLKFDYENRNPLTNQAEVTIIQWRERQSDKKDGRNIKKIR